VKAATPRICDAVPQAQVTDARNCVFMGTSVVNGSGRAVVFATGLATEFGRIYRLTAEMPSEDSPLQREVTVMARRVAAVAIAAGLGLFAIRALASHDVVGSFVFALGVMVALVPEGLPARIRAREGRPARHARGRAGPVDPRGGRGAPGRCPRRLHAIR
jgi:P-type Ca2+ transporter type 2C